MCLVVFCAPKSGPLETGPAACRVRFFPMYFFPSFLLFFRFLLLFSV